MSATTAPGDREQAAALHGQAMALEGQDDDQALAIYHQALALDPDRPETLYNIGLIHKYRGHWVESRDFNARAVALAPEDEAANWNLAIAATALSDWPTARAAWQRLGLQMPPGDGPIQDDFGPALVRLDPAGHAEVVWGQRVCPVRQRLDSVPLPESGFRCGDVVLHDGAPMGSRTSGGREYTVFNALMLHEPSALTTFEVVVQAESAEEALALTDRWTAAGLTAEDWTASVRMLCKACSEGRPHEEHDEFGGPEASWQGRRRLGVAAVDAKGLSEAVEAWAAEVPTRRRLWSMNAALRPPVA